MYIDGISTHELKALIRESVKEEFLAVLNDQAVNSNEKTTKLLTRKEACAMLGISLPTLHDWCLKGIIPSYRINTRIRFKSEDIDKILEIPRGLKYDSRK
jgi:excisionase family DNA binding protein